MTSKLLYLTSHWLYLTAHPLYLWHHTQIINHTTPIVCMITQPQFVWYHMNFIWHHIHSFWNHTMLWHHTPCVPVITPRIPVVSSTVALPLRIVYWLYHTYYMCDMKPTICMTWQSQASSLFEAFNSVCVIIYDVPLIYRCAFVLGQLMVNWPWIFIYTDESNQMSFPSAICMWEGPSLKDEAGSLMGVLELQREARASSGDAIQPSCPLLSPFVPLSSCPQSLPAPGTFPWYSCHHTKDTCHLIQLQRYPDTPVSSI